MSNTDWTDLAAPSLEDFEKMARDAFAALPDEFRALVGGIPCSVDEFPEDDVLAELGLDSPFDLMGLFTGVGLPQGGADPVSGQLPNRIHLYRRPILDYWAESEDGETLGDIITHVLVHEIGHHFGFDDDDMEAIEAAAERE
jgi:predicted Zn-dependent protease with MMP-like domain